MLFSSLNEAVFSLMDLPEEAHVLDIGCRNAGWLTGFMERFPGRISRAIGIDQRDCGFTDFPLPAGVELCVMDCAAGLDCPDDSFDFVFCKDMLECLANPAGLVREIYRVLKPGGMVICVNCDWDSVVYNGYDKELIAKALHAYAIWQQPWMDELDSWIGRRTYGIFRTSGLFDGAVVVHSVVETAFREGCFGYDFSGHIGCVAEQGDDLLTKEEYAAFLADLEMADEEGKYLFSNPYYLYSGRKRMK